MARPLGVTTKGARAAGAGAAEGDAAGAAGRAGSAMRPRLKATSQKALVKAAVITAVPTITRISFSRSMPGQTQLIPAPFRFEEPMTGSVRIGCSGWIYAHW